jgi:hypothetical protein
MMDELPTAINLRTRNPKKYISAICKRCGVHNEDNQHWILCSKNKSTYTQIIKNITQKTLGKEVRQQVINEISQLIILNRPYSQQSGNSSTITVIQGFIPKNLTQNLTLTGTKVKASKLIHKILKELFTKIWVPRCLEWHNSNLVITNSITNSSIEVQKGPNQSVKNEIARSKLNQWYNKFATENTSAEILAYISE